MVDLINKPEVNKYLNNGAYGEDQRRRISYYQRDLSAYNQQQDIISRANEFAEQNRIPGFYQQWLSGDIPGLAAQEQRERVVLQSDIAKQAEQAQSQLDKDMQRKGLYTSTLDTEGRSRIEESASRALAAGEAEIMGRQAQTRAQFQMQAQQMLHQATQAAMDRGLKREELEIAREQARQQGNMALWTVLGEIIGLMV